MISRLIIFFSIFLYCSSLVYSTHFSIGSLSFCVYRRRPYWNIEWRFLGLVVGAEVKSSGCPFRRWIEESGGDAGKAVRMADDQDLLTDCPVSSSFWVGDEHRWQLRDALEYKKEKKSWLIKNQKKCDTPPLEKDTKVARGCCVCGCCCLLALAN